MSRRLRCAVETADLKKVRRNVIQRLMLVVSLSRLKKEMKGKASSEASCSWAPRRQPAGLGLKCHRFCWSSQASCVSFLARSPSQLLHRMFRNCSVLWMPVRILSFGSSCLTSGRPASSRLCSYHLMFPSCLVVLYSACPWNYSRGLRGLHPSPSNFLSLALSLSLSLPLRRDS